MLKNLTYKEKMIATGYGGCICNCGDLNQGSIAEDIVNSIVQPTSNASTCINYISSEPLCPTTWCGGENTSIITSKSCSDSCCNEFNTNNATISLDWFEYCNSTAVNGGHCSDFSGIHAK